MGNAWIGKKLFLGNTYQGIVVDMDFDDKWYGCWSCKVLHDGIISDWFHVEDPTGPIFHIED